VDPNVRTSSRWCWTGATSAARWCSDGLRRRSDFLLDEPDGLELLLTARAVHDDRRPGFERYRPPAEAGEIQGHELSIIDAHHKFVAGDSVDRAPEFCPTRCVCHTDRRAGRGVRSRRGHGLDRRHLFLSRLAAPFEIRWRPELGLDSRRR